MKRLIAVFLIIVCLGALTACDVIGSLLPKEESESVYFVGKVLEKYDTGCLLEVSDEGTSFGLGIGTLIHVGTNIDGCHEYEVGDYLRVEFGGEVAESYPLQLHGASKIEKVAD